MYLPDHFDRAGGEPAPKKAEAPKYSKGYPEVSAPPPRGILNDTLDDASLYRLRQRYAPAQMR